jgi:hypothetical protein
MFLKASEISECKRQMGYAGVRLQLRVNGRSLRLVSLRLDFRPFTQNRTEIPPRNERPKVLTWSRVSAFSVEA